ncbi:MAG: hypothetical protein WCG99_04215 [Candidatus Berkelbacteria bacterium]
MRTEVLSIEAIFAGLWDRRCILFGDTRDTRYNLAHQDSPASPYKINVRCLPDNDFDLPFAHEIGRHLADVLLARKGRPQFHGLFGIPSAGTQIAAGFLREWAQNLHYVALEKTEDQVGRHFRLTDPDEYEYNKGCDFWGVDDLVTSTITKLAVVPALRRPVLGFSVLVDRSGGNAEELLSERGIILSSSATTASMLAYLVSADKISSDQADEIIEKDTAFCRYMADNP